VIREILDVATEGWGVVVTLVELKDIQLPEAMKRAMARQAEAASDPDRMRAGTSHDSHPRQLAVAGVEGFAAQLRPVMVGP
jgi:hypothetical protein